MQGLAGSAGSCHSDCRRRQQSGKSLRLIILLHHNDRANVMLMNTHKKCMNFVSKHATAQKKKS